MPIGLIGKKIGTTHIFGENGKFIPVTVIEAGPCPVTQIKNKEVDGYEALQLGYGSKKEKKVTKPLSGHFRKHSVKPAKVLKEFHFDGAGEFKSGQEIRVDIFKEREYVDVRGVSKGRGFTGVMKRYGFHGLPASHGGHKVHREMGSTGMAQYARVLKGQKFPGRMGGENVCVQNLEVVKVIGDENLILVKGAIPGANGGFVIITEAVKKRIDGLKDRLVELIKNREAKEEEKKKPEKSEEAPKEEAKKVEEEKKSAQEAKEEVSKEPKEPEKKEEEKKEAKKKESKEEKKEEEKKDTKESGKEENKEEKK